MIKGQSGQQLQLFMTGVELQDMVTDSIDRNPIGGMGGTMEKMWATKLRQSRSRGTGHGAGVYKIMQNEGYDPAKAEDGGFSLLHKTNYGGIPEWDKHEVSLDGAHHRIAAAADLERKGKRVSYFPTAYNQNEYPSIKPLGRE